MSSSGGFQGADVEQLRDGGDAVAGGSQRLRALGDRTLTQWSGIHGRAWFGPDADGMDQIVREAARGIAEAAEALRDLGELLRHEAEEQESCSAADGPGRGGVMPGLPWGGRPIIGLPGGGLPLFGPPAEAGQDSAASGQSGWAEWLRDTGGIGRPLEVPPPLRERIWDRVG